MNERASERATAADAAAAAGFLLFFFFFFLFIYFFLIYIYIISHWFHLDGQTDRWRDERTDVALETLRRV